MAPPSEDVSDVARGEFAGALVGFEDDVDRSTEEELVVFGEGHEVGCASAAEDGEGRLHMCEGLWGEGWVCVCGCERGLGED